MTAQHVPVPNGNLPPPAPPGAVQHSREQTPPPAPFTAPQHPSVPETPPGVPVNQAAPPATPVNAQLTPESAKLLAQALAEIPKAPQAPKAPEQVPQGGLNDLDVGKLDDPHLQALGKVFLQTAPGVDLERALGRAIADGDASLVDVNYLREKYGAQAEAIIQLAGNIVNAAASYGDRIASEINAEAGGEANWQTAVAALNANAPEYLRKAAANLINSKSSKDIMDGARLVLSFARDGGYLNNPINPVHGRAAAAAALPPLDKATFQAELAKLDRNAPNYAEAQNAIFYRRQLGKQKGL